MSVESRVKAIIAEQLGISEEDVQLESRLMEDLGADSLDKVELIMAIEAEFEIEISDEEADGMHTIHDVVGYLTAHQ